MRNRFDSVDHYFGRRLREAMDSKGYDAKDLDDMDVASSSSIREYTECGRLPNLRTACRLAEFLDVDLNWLCGFDEEIAWSEAKLQEERKAPWL